MEIRFESLLDVLRYRVKMQPDARAYAFLSERGSEEASLTFAELDRSAQNLAKYLVARAPSGSARC